MNVASLSVDDSVIGKKLRKVFDGERDITPPYVEIIADEFVIEMFENKTIEISNLMYPDNPSTTIDYVIFFNAAGVSLFVEKKDSTEIEIS